MNQDVRRKPNLALIGAVLFSAFCWVCLYAAFADFAQAGFELMARPGLGHSIAGAGMVDLVQARLDLDRFLRVGEEVGPHYQQGIDGGRAKVVENDEAVALATDPAIRSLSKTSVRLCSPGCSSCSANASRALP